MNKGYEENDMTTVTTPKNVATTAEPTAADQASIDTVVEPKPTPVDEATLAWGNAFMARFWNTEPTD